MAGNFRASAGVETPSQGRTAVQGSYVPVRQAPVQQQVPAGYELVYRMGGPRYMYGETPLYGARYADGGIVPGQIYGNMRGSREGADMFGFFPTMFQSQPYATASQMYTPSLGVMPLIGYPSKYPHVVMGGYTDYGAPIANQAISMMLPLLMMGLYRQMFPMMPQAPAQAARVAGGGGGGKPSGGSGEKKSGGASASAAPAEVAMDYSAVDGMPIRPSSNGIYHVQDVGWTPGAGAAAASEPPFYQRWWQGLKDFVGGGSSQPAAPASPAAAVMPAVKQGAATINPATQASAAPAQASATPLAVEAPPAWRHRDLPSSYRILGGAPASPQDAFRQWAADTIADWRLGRELQAATRGVHIEEEE